MGGNIMRELREGNVRKIFLDSKSRSYKCSYCAMVVQLSTVESHLANHTWEVKGRFTCKYCCYTSDIPTSHEAYHHKYLEKPHKFRCEECRFAGDSQRALDSHLSLNLHKEQQFGEPSGKEVERKKSNSFTMANSVRRFGEPSGKEVERKKSNSLTMANSVRRFGKPSGKEVKMKKSNPLTGANSALRMKMFVFMEKTVYRCSFCGMAPSHSPGKLAVHIQRHQMKSDDDLTCKYCSFSWSDVISHQGNHTRFLQKEHKFRCDSCNFAGDTQSAMDAHLFLGLHGENGSSSSMACYQGTKTNITKRHTAMAGDNSGKSKKSFERKGGVKLITTKKTETRHIGAVKHGNTPAISGDVEFRRVKDLCMVRQIGRSAITLCLLCGMSVNHAPSFIKEHDRCHHIMADADNLNKCDYCSYVCSRAFHNVGHKKFLTKHHKFVCGMCNFVCDYKSVLHLHHEVAHHAGNTNDTCDSRNLKETSKSDHDEVTLSPSEDMEVCSDTSKTAGPSSENVKLDFPGPSTSNHVKLVNRGVTESPQLRSIPKSIKTEADDDEDDDIEVISVIPPSRQVPVQRQTLPDIFRCPFCPFLVNVAKVMMTHLHSHAKDTSGQAAPQQPTPPLSVQFPVGAATRPQIHPQPLLQTSQFVPQQPAYWQPQASGGASQQTGYWQPQTSGGASQQTPYWQPQTSGGAPQQMMNQVAYPQGLIQTQFQNQK